MLWYCSTICMYYVKPSLQNHYLKFEVLHFEFIKDINGIFNNSLLETACLYMYKFCIEEVSQM